MFEGVEFNAMQFVGPLLVLIATMVSVGLIYRLLFSWLPKRLYSALTGPVLLMSVYTWAVPMNLGFHTYFQ